MNCELQGLPQVYSRVYQAVDGSIAMQTCLPRTDAMIQDALYRFRHALPDREALEQLQAMSLKLEEMRVAYLSGDRPGCLVSQAELKRLIHSWIEHLPIH